MGRRSSREEDEKTIFQKAREKRELTREKASEAIGYITPEKLFRIENEEYIPSPKEIVDMARAYKRLNLCNEFCYHHCEIGKQEPKDIQEKSLQNIVLEMIDSLNTLQENQKRLIQITVDGAIQDSEIGDYVSIQKELNRIAVAVETMQLWIEQTKNEGKINIELYETLQKEN